MALSDLSDKLVVLAIGVLVLLAPALIVLLTISFLTVSGDLVLRNVSLLEFLELYLLDLVLFAAFAYGLYRLTLRFVTHRLPSSLDALDSDTNEETDVVEVSDDRE